jgi:ParB-like chromosome segregation protein Spo0J
MASASITRRRAHRYAANFPQISGDELEALVADIREHGQREPSKLDSDVRVLDGLNWLRAFGRLDIGARVQLVDLGADDAAAVVLSQQLVRRNMTRPLPCGDRACAVDFFSTFLPPTATMRVPGAAGTSAACIPLS